MGLFYILQQVGYKMGKNPSDATQRAVILRFVNEAAEELYAMSDMSGCLEEQCFKVNSNQTISLPEYVGQIRAMRVLDDHIAIKLSQMRPRYNQFNWPDEWRNWRIKGLQTLQTSLRNQSKLIVSVPQIENPPVVVTITGPTIGTSLANESITMTATTMNTANEYLDVASFTKAAVNNFDVILSDIDNNQISFIPNNKLKALFQEVDISTAPWFYPNQNPLIGWVEVLYKKSLSWLQNDSDEFIAPKYDRVIVNKCLQLWYEEQNNVQGAMAYYQKAMQSLAQIHEDANRGTDDTVSLVENPHDLMNPRIGFGRDWRFAYRIIGR